MECSREIKKLMPSKCVDIFMCKVPEEYNITLKQEEVNSHAFFKGKKKILKILLNV